MSDPKKPSDSSIRAKIWITLGALSTVLLGGWLLTRWRNRRDGLPEPRSTGFALGRDTQGFRGLNEEEATGRQPDFDMDEEIREEQRRFMWSALRQNLISIFNVNLIGITIIMLLLDNFWGAFGSFLVLVINLIIKVAQQSITKIRLDKVLRELRPQAVVIRDGRLHGIDPVNIVIGDHLVLGEGDEIPVDGELLSESAITIEIAGDQDGGQMPGAQGDHLQAGHFCVEGRGVYRAEENGYPKYSKPPGSRVKLLMGELTPLQRMMSLVLRVLLGIVIVFSAMLVANAISMNVFQSDTPIVAKAYQNAFSIIFGIAPTSMFFALVITYAMGAFRLLQKGVLVYEAETIEALSNIQTLCISNESLISGVNLQLAPINPPGGGEPISENVIRRFLGAAVQSAYIPSRLAEMLAEALPDDKYTPLEVGSHLNALGWFGISFDEDDMRGTFILGVPDVLEGSLAKDRTEQIQQTVDQARRGLTSRLGGLFRRRGDEEAPDEGPPDGSEGENGLLPATSSPASKIAIVDDNETEAALESSPSEDAEVQDETPGFAQRMRARLERMLTPLEEIDELDEGESERQEGINLLFAYLPEPISLTDRNGRPSLPGSLIPVSHVNIRSAVRPEAETAIHELVEAGLDVKILAAASPERAAMTARQLGLLDDETPMMIAGDELTELSTLEFAREAGANTIFGNLTPAQKASLVRVLSKDAGPLLMVGSKVSDVPALREADIRVVLRSSEQAALRLTDILMLEDSLEKLPDLPVTGQRLVSGLLDTFNLNFSHVLAQLLLILTLPLASTHHFPYNPTQGGMINVFTVAIPSILLSAWAAAGRLNERSIRHRLSHFIFPAAITMTALILAVEGLFLRMPREVPYVQLAVTWALLAAGWLRVLFVQPPTPFWTGGAPLRGDRRVIWLVVVTVLIFLLIIAVPLFQEWMSITWLESFRDVGWVLLAAALWGLAIRTIWRLMKRGWEQAG